MGLGAWFALGSAPTAKPAAQLATGGLPSHAGDHLHAVMGAGVADQIQAAAQGPTLGVAGAEHHPAHPGLDRRPRAHAAGLQGHHQGAAVQPPVAQHPCRLGHGADLGMAQGVLVTVAAVAAPAHTAALGVQHHCGHRNFPASPHGRCPAQQAFHPELQLGVGAGGPAVHGVLVADR